MLYSSLTQDDQLKLVADFKRRYGVTAKFWRGSQAHILPARAQRNARRPLRVRRARTNAPQIEVLAREKLLQKMNSAFHRAGVAARGHAGPRRMAPDRLNLLVYAYNTPLVKPADVPRSWQDLLDPKWKRRIGMESTKRGVVRGPG